jgi:uncharacterized membrane protein
MAPSEQNKTTTNALAPTPRLALGALVLAAATIASGFAAQAQDQSKAAPGKEKCYGVAKAGENGCQSLSGAHTCGGCSTVDYSGENWKWVAMGTCGKMGGQLKAFDGFGPVASVTPKPESPQR